MSTDGNVMNPYAASTKNCTASIALLAKLQKSVKQYPPLKAAEERELIDKHRADPVMMRQMLINHNIRMVFAFTHRYAGTAYDYDEMVGNALLGLAMAAERFDLDCGIKFSTYAQHWIRKMALRQYYENEEVKISRNGISLDMKLGGENEDGEATMANYLERQMLPEAYGESEHITGVNPTSLVSEDVAMLFKKMQCYIEKTDGLNALERKVFIEMFINHKSAPDIARLFNVTNPAICFIRKKLNNILKDYLSTECGVNSFLDVFTK